MATLLIRLEIDPVTHKKNVWVKYESDADALPQEHEIAPYAQRMIDERAANTPQLAAYVESAAPRRIPVFSITPVG